ncbi:MAG: PHP domain-containing protein [Clostridia bacterium]|nr:PHP domain-containing protein [Clostridia bacterium]
MILTADFHTHTKFSHGKGTILQNAISAKEKGIRAIAITDHGYGHTVYGIKHRKVPYMKNLCKEAETQTGVKVLFGVEANVLGLSGKTDARRDDMEYFDVLLGGIHKMITYDKLEEWFKLFGANALARKTGKVSPELVKRNTKVYINAIKSNPIDILVHPNYCVFASAVEVAKCCRDYGTYFEIDARKTHLTDEEWFEVAQTGVKFVIDSDAHHPSKVGDLGYVESLIERVNINKDQIVNIDGKYPDYFRFKEYKNKL